MIIILTGVSGAGKTTIGRALAEELHWRFAEGDDFLPETLPLTPLLLIKAREVALVLLAARHQACFISLSCTHSTVPTG